MSEKTKLLITGAAGRIGTAYHKHIADRYTVRITDRMLIPDSEGQDSLVLDLSDPDAARQACEGMDTVLHLAANPNTTAEFYKDLLDANFKATYNIFRTAKDQGCKRVIFASSVNAVGGYPRERQVRTDDAPCPSNVYGASKAFGESLGAYFAACEGLSNIAIRIGAVGHPSDVQPAPTNFVHSIFVTYNDLCLLIDRCIETPDIQFAVVNGVSNNRVNWLDLTATSALLGYHPQDDAFTIAEQKASGAS
jgi:nucleoside-diphosphate-sugar epimerase